MLERIWMKFYWLNDRLRWYCHVVRKDDDDWVKKCITLEVEGARQRGRPRKTWKEVLDKDVNSLYIGNWSDRCQELNTNCTSLVPAHRG